MCENAQSPDDIAACWDYVLTGLEAEAMGRNDTLESSARKVYLGRAGPPQHVWKEAEAPKPNEPSDLNAWKALARWLRHLRSARVNLLSQVASRHDGGFECNLMAMPK
eukprot:7682028-Pyramimonas_sp.AAC.1